MIYLEPQSYKKLFLINIAVCQKKHFQIKVGIRF